MWRRITIMGYKVTCKIFDEPSGFGLFGGRISKMLVSKNGQELLNYDRGMDFSHLPGWFVKRLVDAIEAIF